MLSVAMKGLRQKSCFYFMILISSLTLEFAFSVRSHSQIRYTVRWAYGYSNVDSLVSRTGSCCQHYIVNIILSTLCCQHYIANIILSTLYCQHYIVNFILSTLYCQHYIVNMRCFGSHSEPTETVGLRKFHGVVAIITASGIGRALAEALVGKGAQAVVLVDRQVELAEEVAAGICAQADCDTAVKVYEADVTDYAAVERVVAETHTTYGQLNYIFNNAGISVVSPTNIFPVDDFDCVIDVNVLGVSHGVQAAYPVMKEQKFGHIVNTGSVSGLVAVSLASSYSASKYVAIGLSTSLRVEAAEYGVRVSVLCVP